MKPKKTILAAAGELCCYGAAAITTTIIFVLFFIIIDGQAAFAHSANPDHVSSLDDDGKARTVMSYGELVLAVVPFTAALAGSIFILFKKR
jgi:large-conductance mechanosensitive channel